MTVTIGTLVQKAIVRVPCGQCGKLIINPVRRQIFCEECSRERKRTRSREAERRRRTLTPGYREKERVRMRKQRRAKKDAAHKPTPRIPYICITCGADFEGPKSRWRCAECRKDALRKQKLAWYYRKVNHDPGAAEDALSRAYRIYLLKKKKQAERHDLVRETPTL